MRLLTWAKKYSEDDNEMYYIVRRLNGRLGIYNYENRPKHCTVLYDVFGTEVYRHQ